MPLINVIDGAITARIIYLLVQPWDQTKAYKHGIIDKDGNPLRKSDDLKTAEERAAYTVLDRLIFKLKRILQGIPFVNRNLANFAAALWFIKETHDKPDQIQTLLDDSVLNETILLKYSTYERLSEINELKEYMQHTPTFVLYRAFLNEDGAAVGGGAPVLGNAPSIDSIANRAGSGKVAGFTPDSVGRKKLVSKIIRRRRPPIGEPSNITNPLV